MKKRWTLALAAVVVTAVGAFGLSIGGAQSAPPDTDEKLRRVGQQAATGPATRVLSTDDVQIIGIWRNGQGHIIRMPMRRVLVNTEVAPMERLEPAIPDPQAFIDRHLPRPTPGLDPRFDVPTPEQSAAMNAQVQAEQLEANPWMVEANKRFPVPPGRPGG
jgi:hypothetical protein